MTTVRSTGRDYRDILAGGIMLAFGLFCAIYAQEHYKMGSATRMGPGWYPVYVGYLLTIIGAIIMIPAFFRKGDAIEVKIKPAILLPIGTFLFAWTFDVIGLVPAVVLQIFASTAADTKLGFKGSAILAACTAAVTYLIFAVGLGLNLQAFIWPFQS